MGIREAVKKIYSTENALQKHIIIFLITGISSMLAMPLNEISTRQNLSSGEWWSTLILLILCLVATFYIFGYTLRAAHNSYNETDIMPVFSNENFKVIFKAMPILLSWLGYLIIFSIIMAICISLIFVLKTYIPVILLFVLFAITVTLLPMVFAEFAEDYNCKGLLGIHKPYTYLKKGFKDIALVILKLLPIFLVIQVISAICMSYNNVLTYILVALVGYVGAIYQLTLYYNFVQIIKDKFKRV